MVASKPGVVGILLVGALRWVLGSSAHVVGMPSLFHEHKAHMVCEPELAATLIWWIKQVDRSEDSQCLKEGNNAPGGIG